MFYDENTRCHFSASTHPIEEAGGIIFFKFSVHLCARAMACFCLGSHVCLLGESIPNWLAVDC